MSHLGEGRGREIIKCRVFKVRTRLTCLKNFKLAGAERVGVRVTGNEIREGARGQIMQVKVRTWNFFTSTMGNPGELCDEKQKTQFSLERVSWATAWRACPKWLGEKQLLRAWLWGRLSPQWGPASRRAASTPAPKYSLLPILCAGPADSLFSLLNRDHCVYPLHEWVDVFTSVKR